MTSKHGVRGGGATKALQRKILALKAATHSAYDQATTSHTSCPAVFCYNKKASHPYKYKYFNDTKEYTFYAT
ncbi:hypothetical protein KDW_47000 [Dictyobacter vulcani]|uniref:Uncharacterized protein n=1 Tax=Dictyobacter vulcani TaxID=2607529 RepID=A0A5J4KLF1_9CHLR|nr:hypothetical protein KDW_47000 [Dictyobacter vulcani]